MSSTTSERRGRAQLPLCVAFLLIKMSLLLSCSSMISHHCVHGFTNLAGRGRFFQRINKSAGLSRLYSSLKEQEGQIKKSQIVEIGKKAKQQQFWLDLRETAVTPTEALAFMQKALLEDDDQDEECDSDGNILVSLVDKIVISNQDRSKLSKKLLEKMKGYDIELLHVKPSDSDGQQLLYSIEDEQDCGNEFGKIVPNSSSLTFNPLSALDITSSGQWFVMDLDKEGDAKSQQEQVSNLVNLLSSTSSALISTGGDSSETDLTKLFLVGSKENTESSVTPLKFAVTCSDPNLLWTMDATLAEFHYVNSITTSVGATMTTSESGIFIPLAGKPEEAMQAVPDPNIPTLQTALVLPFDLNLWKTVLDLKQMGTITNEDETET